MKTLRLIIVGIIGFVILGTALFFCGYYYGSRSVEPGVIHRDKIITRTIYRDYPTVTREECIDKLRCYDTRDPLLDIRHVEGITYHLSAGLCEREWGRDVQIEVGRSGAWRYYIGTGVAAGLVAAYLLMR